MEFNKPFLGTIKDYGIMPSNDNSPLAWVKFEIVDPESKESVIAKWLGGFKDEKFGKMKETSRTYTMQTLTKMGFKGALLDVAKLDDGPAGMALNGLIEYSLTLEKSGEYLNVKYVNLPGETGVGKKYDSKADLMKALGSLATANNFGL